MVEHSLLVQWLVGLNPHGGSIQLFGVTKVMVCVMVHIKDPLLLIKKKSL